MAPEVGPAFQRLSRDTPSSNLGVRLAETASRHVGSKEMRAFWHFGRGITYKILVFGSFAIFAFMSRVGQTTPRSLAFVSRCEPPRARAGPANDIDDIRE
eukprot:gene19786-biopygen13053